MAENVRAVAEIMEAMVGELGTAIQAERAAAVNQAVGESEARWKAKDAKMIQGAADNTARLTRQAERLKEIEKLYYAARDEVHQTGEKIKSLEKRLRDAEHQAATAKRRADGLEAVKR